MDNITPTPLGDNQDKLAAIIACIPLFFWVPILMEKKTEYVVHFMKHGFAFLVVAIALNILGSIAGILIILLAPLFALINIALFIAIIYMIYHAATGKKATLPYFTEYVEKALIQLNITSWFQAQK